MVTDLAWSIMQVEMSDEMHVTKAEPVLQWQTKEEFQRWEIRVHEAKQRRKDGVEDEKEGRKRGREIQSDGEGEKVESESNEGKHRRGPRHGEQLKESEEVKTKGEKKGASENSVKLIPTSQGRIKEEIKRIKEENMRFKDKKLVDQAERGIKETRRGRESQRRVSEVGDICNNNEKSGVGEETRMSVSVSEDTVGWLLGNNRRALAFIQEHCNVSMNVEERKRGGGRPIVLISGSLKEVSKAGEIVKLDVGQPQLVLTDAGATRLTKDRSRVEER